MPAPTITRQSIRARRVLAYLKETGPATAEYLPTEVAANFVMYVTDRIERDYDNAVTDLLDAGLAEQYDGEDGYCYIRATAA